jgi:O-antigen/teichoic acid export membrane protein
MTGTTIAQAIPIAISPILTRIYTPEDFGVFALYMAIASIISVIVTGRYELAIMLPRRDDDAAHIVVLSLIITITISFSVFIFVYLFNKEISKLLENSEISLWLYFIPLTILLTGIYQTLNYWKNRNKEYHNIALSRVTSTSTNAVINLLSLIQKIGSAGLILGSIIGQFFGTIVLLRSNKNLFSINFKTVRIIALAKKYKKFPLINSLHAFINILKNNIAQIFISLKYTSEILGYYYFVIRIMQVPSSIIQSSLAQVFYKKASEKYNNDKNIQIMVSQLILNLVKFAVLPAAVLFFYSVDIFIFIFGEDWHIAGDFGQVLVPYIFFHFIASPLGMIPLITNQQGSAFYWGLAESILFVSVFVFGYYIFNDIYNSLILLSVVFSMYFPIYFRWIYLISKGTKHE